MPRLVARDLFEGSASTSVAARPSNTGHWWIIPPWNPGGNYYLTGTGGVYDQIDAGKSAYLNLLPRGLKYQASIKTKAYSGNSVGILLGVGAASARRNSIGFFWHNSVPGWLCQQYVNDSSSYIGSESSSQSPVSTARTLTARRTGNLFELFVDEIIVRSQVFDWSYGPGYAGIANGSTGSPAQDFQLEEFGLVTYFVPSRNFALMARPISGSIGIEGDININDEADIAAISGNIMITGSLHLTELNDIAASIGDVIVAGSMNSVEAVDTIIGNGNIEVIGVMTIIDETDLISLDGNVLIDGAISSIELQDTVNAEGVLAISGESFSTESQDITLIVGDVVLTGVMTSSETIDIAGISGSQSVNGVMTSNEVEDIGVGVGHVLLIGIMATAESPDVNSSIGDVIVAGSMNSVEAVDTLSAIGSVVQPNSYMAALESRDQIVISGIVIIHGLMTSSERMDRFAGIGMAEVAEIELSTSRNVFDYRTSEATRFGISGIHPFSRINMTNTEVRLQRTKHGTFPVTYVKQVSDDDPLPIIPSSVR